MQDALATDNEVCIRVGIPTTGGHLVKVAKQSGYQTLFSANAFAKTYPKGHERAGEFWKFSMPNPEQFEGLDAALDSAGYVAAAKYGDYRWSPEEYVELAASRKWAFWASMDYCCEPQVSGDRLLRLLRIAATAQLLGQCNRLAKRRGMPLPMPVIQGWTSQEYRLCADWLPVEKWPSLVGIGSVCRRHLGGEDGLRKILGTLDEALPHHVKWHLFGVKSSALQEVGQSHRVASMDSMAWDYQARVGRL